MIQFCEVVKSSGKSSALRLNYIMENKHIPSSRKKTMIIIVILMEESPNNALHISLLINI